MKKVVKDFYGENPCQDENYPKIINQKHFDRLLALLENEEIILGGEYSEHTLKIAPTIVDNVSWNSPLMQEEIFGPILPVLEFKDLTDVIYEINKHPKPLALYLFTTSKENEQKVLRDISFGGGCINDTIMHLVTSHMPFGGVGESGMGRYHGKSSFDTFSNYKSILKKSNLIDIPLRYPSHKNLNLMKKFMK
jgi:aldehyde dehydrogenase (NAD+)